MLVPIYLLLLYASVYATKLKRISNYIGTYLFWNGSIRMYIELYQDFTLNSSLNMHTLEYESPFEDVRNSNIYAFTTFALVCTIPLIFFLPHYCCKKSKWFDADFELRYGALLEGTDKKTRFATMLFPSIFLIRRLAFVASVLLLGEYLIA